MADTPTPSAALHPVHAVLLSSTLPLFLGAVLSDWAYNSSFEMQWANFAAWLVAGGLVFAGLALLWSMIDNLRPDRASVRGKWLAAVLLAATFALGFVNALIHARDAFAIMPAGLYLSLVVFVLALAAVWASYTQGRGAVR